MPRPAASKTLTYEAWAIVAPGLESLLAAELQALGFVDAEANPGGVAFRCDLGGLARANLNTRVASRIVVRLAAFKATAFHELERAARKVEWARMLPEGAAFDLRVTARKSRLYHTDAIAERVADAITRGVKGARASEGVDDDGDAESVLPVEMDAPPAEAAAQTVSQRFLVRFVHDRCTISADSSGPLLHRRGYRQAVARAPLRETLAAAMLAGARYDASQALVDPFCGSGTLPIEAAMLARRIAPGLGRPFAAEAWPEGDASVWLSERAEAESRILPRAPAPIEGSDRDEGAITAAESNAVRAGVADDVRFTRRALSDLELPTERGLLVSNPPYGLRVGEKAPLRDLYSRLGQVVRARGAGWRVALLSADRALEGHTGLRFTEALKTSNGGIPVRLVIASARGSVR